MGDEVLMNDISGFLCILTVGRFFFLLTLKNFSLDWVDFCLFDCSLQVIKVSNLL